MTNLTTENTNIKNTNLIAMLEGVIATLKKVNDIETQVALVNSQLRAMQDSNNQLAEIAFDENKFTQQLLDKVDEVARESARDTIDVDDIAEEVRNTMDVSEDVARCVERLGCVTSDDVNDAISDYMNDNDYKTESEVEDLIENYLNYNDYICKSDVQDLIQEEITDLEEQIATRVLQLIANKLTGKDTHHANNTYQNDHSLQLSGTIGQSQAESNGSLSA